MSGQPAVKGTTMPWCVPCACYSSHQHVATEYEHNALVWRGAGFCCCPLWHSMQNSINSALQQSSNPSYIQDYCFQHAMQKS